MIHSSMAQSDTTPDRWRNEAGNYVEWKAAKFRNRGNDPLRLHIFANST